MVWVLTGNAEFTFNAIAESLNKLSLKEIEGTFSVCLINFLENPVQSIKKSAFNVEQSLNIKSLI